MHEEPLAYQSCVSLYPNLLFGSSYSDSFKQIFAMPLKKLLYDLFRSKISVEIIACKFYYFVLRKTLIKEVTIVKKM